MDVIAQVFNWKITRTELDFEESRVKKLYPEAEASEIRNYALSQLVDRYLLMQEAINHGISITEEEFEEALFILLEDMDAPETSVLLNRNDRGEQIERVLRSTLIIHKYISTLDVFNQTITKAKLQQFYTDRSEFFSQKDEVRASHILIKGDSETAQTRIQQIRDSIKNVEDFIAFSRCESDCPSGTNCGDLGYFPRGRMIPKIEKVAFSLKVNEISQPFQTKFGYHILMVTDIRTKHTIPFEEIKDCLSDSLKDIEEEITKTRILAEIRERSENAVQIFDNAFE